MDYLASPLKVLRGESMGDQTSIKPISLCFWSRLCPLSADVESALNGKPPGGWVSRTLWSLLN